MAALRPIRPTVGTSITLALLGLADVAGAQVRGEPWQLGLELSPLMFRHQTLEDPPATVTRVGDAGAGQSPSPTGVGPDSERSELRALPVELGMVASALLHPRVSVGARVLFSSLSFDGSLARRLSLRVGPLVRLHLFTSDLVRLGLEVGGAVQIQRDVFRIEASMVGDPVTEQNRTGFSGVALAQVVTQWPVSEDLSIDPALRLEYFRGGDPPGDTEGEGARDTTIAGVQASLVVGFSYWGL